MTTTNLFAKNTSAMTYCVALRLQEGMLFASDTRTNAGVDHVAIFRKMRIFSKGSERYIVVLSAGNLGTTQSVMSLMEQKINHGVEPNPHSHESMFDVAAQFGQALKEVQVRDGGGELTGGVDFSATLLVGGQIRGEGPRLFLIYPQGNFIEAAEDTCYFQIGEAKYGKPILDRVVRYDTALSEAAKCVLISFDSTIRSNLSVGLPVDMLWLPADQFAPSLVHRFERDDPYFSGLSQAWSRGLREVFSGLPDIPND